ncbi:MAG TPA: hypothetical protein VGL95_14715 [Acetobacteraceae bacterium]|jgi:hypothetical protein
MPRFEVVVSERVTVRYHAVIVEAEDYTAAATLAEALRLDGDLGDPESETEHDPSFEVAPHLDTDPTIAEAQFVVTAAGRAALEPGGEDGGKP